MRALPALSVEYLDETVLGNTVLPAAAGPGAGVRSRRRCRSHWRRGRRRRVRAALRLAEVIPFHAVERAGILGFLILGAALLHGQRLSRIALHRKGRKRHGRTHGYISHHQSSCVCSPHPCKNSTQRPTRRQIARTSSCSVGNLSFRRQAIDRQSGRFLRETVQQILPRHSRVRHQRADLIATQSFGEIVRRNRLVGSFADP